MGEDQNYNLSGNVHSIISGNYGTGTMGLRSGNSHIINSLPEGRYQWRVRSVDHSLSFSDWSDWDYFYIDQSPPCLLYTSPSPRDATLSRMPSSA